MIYFVVDNGKYHDSSGVVKKTRKVWSPFLESRLALTDFHQTLMDVGSLAINDIVKVHHCFILGLDLLGDISITSVCRCITFRFIHHIVNEDESGGVHLKLLGWGML